MKSYFFDKYGKAAATEIQTLEDMGAWDVVDKSEGKEVIERTWTFKVKWYLNSLINKFNAKFYTRDDQQIDGVEFFKTYLLVVQWKTVCLMLTLEVLLDLKSKKAVY